MHKILIINTPGLYNRGGMAAVMGALEGLGLRATSPTIEFLTHHYDDYCRRLSSSIDTSKVIFTRHSWLKTHKFLPLSVGHTVLAVTIAFFKCKLVKAGILNPTFSPYFNCDIILDMNIDSLHDNYGIFHPLWTLANISLGLFAGKPVVVWGAGIGKFNNPIIKAIARRVLNKVTLICCREANSMTLLKTIGVTKPKIVVTADHAFLLNPAPRAHINSIILREFPYLNGKPLVGISPSQMIHRFGHMKQAGYITAMAGFAEHLIARYDVNVLFVPHVIAPNDDDRVLSVAIRREIMQPERVAVLAGDYDAAELKGIIGQCEMFIGCRMHTTIAATSMGVPTISVVYGNKSQGIIGDMMGQASYIVEIEDLNARQLAEKLCEKTADAWLKRDTIRGDLKKRQTTVRFQALLNVQSVVDLLNTL